MTGMYDVVRNEKSDTVGMQLGGMSGLPEHAELVGGRMYY